MKAFIPTVSLLATLLLASSAIAQPGPDQGMMHRQGMGSRMECSKFCSGKNNVYGWQLMSAEEREAHQQKMRSMKTYEECKAYQDEHHSQMEARAKEQGKTLPAPRYNGCDRMKDRGFFK